MHHTQPCHTTTQPLSLNRKKYAERLRALKETVITSAWKAGVSDFDIAAFYNAHWARPISLTRQDFCEWQFREAPAAGGKNHSVVALRGNELLAVMGTTPAQFRLSGKSCLGAELTTWVVAPSARGNGIGRDILAYLQDNYEVLAGAGITTAAQPLYLSAGFTFLSHIPRFFYVVDFEQSKNFTKISDFAAKVQHSRQTSAPRIHWKANSVAAVDLTEVAEITTLSGFIRNRGRLAWRHDQHPTFHYEAFVVQNILEKGAGAGIILREDIIANTPTLHVIDIFGSPEHFSAALAFVEEDAIRRGAAFIDISATDGQLGAQLRARGWSSAVDDTLIEMPSLFHPVELRRPPTTSMVIWARTARDKLFDFSRLHVSKSDLDLDRPTLNWYESNFLEKSSSEHD